MKIISYNGVTFSSLNVAAKFVEPDSPGPQRDVPAIARIAREPMVEGVVRGTHTIRLLFTVTTGNQLESTLMGVLAALNPDDPEERVLVAQLVGGTNVQTMARIGSWSYPNVNQLMVDFIVTTPGWKASSPSTILTTATKTADGSFANGNTGKRDVYPTITIQWPGTQRSSTTSTFGWKKAMPATITNTGAEPLRNQPYQLGPLDTRTLVTNGFMRSDCDDLRVFAEGKELPRALIGPNTRLTLIWIVLPDLMPGESIRLELAFDNPNAGSPPTFSYSSSPARPAMDISGTAFQPTSSAATTATLTGAGWETDQWKGATVLYKESSGARHIRRCVGNTAATITVDRAWSVPSGTADIIITKSGIYGTGGTISAGTSTSLTDSTAAWATNEWIGAKVTLNADGSGGWAIVLSNTATVLTTTAFSGSAPASPNPYNIHRFNGQRVWDVRTVKKSTLYKGLWATNKSETPPSGRNWDAPGSWYRFVYQRSKDSYSQPSVVSFLIGGSDYDHFPVMRIRRARRGRAGDQTEVGVADAIGVASPFGILGIYFGYSIRNAKKAGSSPAAGMVEARFMCQEAGGENWASFLSDTDVHTSTANVAPAHYDLTRYGTPIRVGMTVIPNGSDEIPDSDNNTAELSSYGEFVRLVVDPTASVSDSVDWLSGSMPSWANCYDVYLIIRNGGASPSKPYDRLVIGGPGRRLFILTPNEYVTIDCDTKLVTIKDNFGNFSRHIPYAVEAEKVVSDPVTAADRAVINASWLPIHPDGAAVYFSDPSGAGWGNLSIGAVGTLGYYS